MTFLNCVAVRLESDFQFVSAAHQHTNRAVYPLRRRKNKRARHYPCPAGQRLIFNASLVSPNRDLAFSALL